MPPKYVAKNHAKCVQEKVNRFKESEVSETKQKSFKTAKEIVNSQKDYIYYDSEDEPILSQRYTQSHHYVKLIMSDSASKTTLKKYRKKMIDEKNKMIAKEKEKK